MAMLKNQRVPSCNHVTSAPSLSRPVLDPSLQQAREVASETAKSRQILSISSIYGGEIELVNC